MATVPTNVPAGKTISLASLALPKPVPFNVPANTTAQLATTKPSPSVIQERSAYTPTSVPTNVPAGVTYNQQTGSTIGTANTAEPSVPFNTSLTSLYNNSAPGSGAAANSPSGVGSYSSMMSQSQQQNAPSTPGTATSATTPAPKISYLDMLNSDPQYKSALQQSQKYYNTLQDFIASKDKDIQSIDSDAMKSPVTNSFYNNSLQATDRHYMDNISRSAQAYQGQQSLIDSIASKVRTNYTDQNPDTNYTAYANDPNYLAWLKQQTVAKQDPLNVAYKQAQIDSLQAKTAVADLKVFRDPVSGQQYVVDINGKANPSSASYSAPSSGVSTGGSTTPRNTNAGAGSAGVGTTNNGGIYANAIRTVGNTKYMSDADFSGIYAKQAAQQYAAANGLPWVPASSAKEVQKAATGAQKISAQLEPVKKMAKEVLRTQTALQAATFGSIQYFAAKTAFDQKSKLYSDMVNNAASLVSKGVFGEAGALAEGDVQRAIKALGDFKDTTSNVQEKAQNIDKVIQANIDAAVNGYIGTYKNATKNTPMTAEQLIQKYGKKP